MKKSQLKLLIKTIIREAVVNEVDDDDLRRSLNVNQQATVDTLMKRGFVISKSERTPQGIVPVLTRGYGSGKYGSGKYGGMKVAKINLDGTINHGVSADEFLKVVREDGMKVNHEFDQGREPVMGFV